MNKALALAAAVRNDDWAEVAELVDAHVEGWWHGNAIDMISAFQRKSYGELRRMADEHLMDIAAM